MSGRGHLWGIIFLVVTAVALISCDSTESRSARSDITVKDVRGPGFVLLEQFCGDCHRLPKPMAHRAKEWPDVVARMLGNMHRGGKPTPDQEQIEQLLDYLQDNARKPS